MYAKAICNPNRKVTPSKGTNTTHALIPSLQKTASNIQRDLTKIQAITVKEVASFKWGFHVLGWKSKIKPRLFFTLFCYLSLEFRASKASKSFIFRLQVMEDLIYFLALFHKFLLLLSVLLRREFLGAKCQISLKSVRGHSHTCTVARIFKIISIKPVLINDKIQG